MLEAIPIEAERSVLGALLNDSASVPEVAAVIDADSFGHAPHGMIFEAIAAAVATHQIADVVTVYERLKAAGHAEVCGGMVHLTELMQSVPSARNAVRHAGIVADYSRRRHVQRIAAEVPALLADADGADSVIDRLHAELGQMQRARASGEPEPLPPELLPVEPFPMQALADAFGPWVQDVAQRIHCPPDFVAVPLLVAAASLVARHVGIRPQRRTDWIERGNLWALIVGRPAG